MPSIKCTSCGHRHFQPVSECINCGAPLDMARPAVQAQKQDSASVVIPPPRLPHTDTHRQQGTVGDNTETTRQLVTKGQDNQQLATNQRWRKHSALQEYGQYDVAPGFASQDPLTSIALHPTNAQEERWTADPELWKKDTLPWTFPKVKPGLSGKVIHMESKEEVLDHPDIWAAIMSLLVELLWTILNVQQARDTDRIVMTTVRIKTYDDTLRDARLLGNMRGADLSLGDEVSLWGRKRRGVLFVQRGFNHTTKGIISTRAMGLLLPALVAVVIICAAIYFMPSWLPFLSHSFIDNLSNFFSFLQHHPVSVPGHKK